MRVYAERYKEKHGRSAWTRYPKADSGTWISADRRRAIYARDEGICGICGDAVEMLLGTNEDMAPSLDHIIPRSLGGTNDDDNLRLAHRLCNSRRGIGETNDAEVSAACG
jgi:5-methylcytosine-specific restriction endonuclease McrA